MSKGSIFAANGKLLLQLGEAVDGLVLVCYIKKSDKAQQVPGCDPKLPCFFIRRTPENGLQQDYFVWLSRNSTELLHTDRLAFPEAQQLGALGAVMLEAIYDCAKQRKRIPENLLLKYFG